MQIATLKAAIREKTGKEFSKKLRSNGLIPANMHGGEKSLPLQVNTKLLLQIISKSHSEHPIVEIEFDGTNPNSHAILKELQRDPVLDTIVHADFLKIDMTKKIKVKVPVEIIGKSKGIIEDGGLLNLIHRELEIESLPGAIPEKISIDVTGLGLNETIHVADIPTGEDYKIVEEGTTAIVSIVLPREEVTAAPAEAAAEEVAAGAEAAEGKAAPAADEKAPKEKDSKDKDKK
ncbi:MAG: 50S ribosomal protein L25 [Candidatus Schekmanbacteria bacterium]|nr:50S ribosomal protein L25 [Candidatus Schekmanbacteria bacterium]